MPGSKRVVIGFVIVSLGASCAPTDSLDRFEDFTSSQSTQLPMVVTEAWQSLFDVISRSLGSSDLDLLEGKKQVRDILIPFTSESFIRTGLQPVMDLSLFGTLMRAIFKSASAHVFQPSTSSVRGLPPAKLNFSFVGTSWDVWHDQWLIDLENNVYRREVVKRFFQTRGPSLYEVTKKSIKKKLSPMADLYGVSLEQVGMALYQKNEVSQLFKQMLEEVRPQLSGRSRQYRKAASLIRTFSNMNWFDSVERNFIDHLWAVFDQMDSAIADIDARRLYVTQTIYVWMGYRFGSGKITDLDELKGLLTDLQLEKDPHLVVGTLSGFAEGLVHAGLSR